MRSKRQVATTGLERDAHTSRWDSTAANGCSKTEALRTGNSGWGSLAMARGPENREPGP